MNRKTKQISNGVNPNIFKAYDVRGIYPKEINKETAYLIGRAFVEFLDKKNLKIAVGRDNRLSSPEIFKTLAKGITDQGANVIDLGLATTPLLYFATAYFEFDGGINITGSHLSGEKNGFKFVREKAIPISEKTGLNRIRKLVLEADFKSAQKGKIIKKECLAEYIRFNLKSFNLNTIRPLRIVIDTANAVSGVIIPKIFKNTNCKIFHLYSKLDGKFPVHNPDPLIKENLESSRKEVLNKRADLGVAFDGDGDRIIFIDEKGEIISGDLITALLTKIILEKNAGQKVLYDIRSSNIVRETIEKAGGRPIAWRIGHSLIKEKMRKENVIFAGELSGHYFHREHYFCESPIFVLFTILETLSQSQHSFSETMKPFKIYFYSGEMNFEVKDKEKIIKKLEKKFGSGKLSKLDGLRVDSPDWWFLARPSNTEPLLRLVIEARTKKLLQEYKKRLTALIKK